LPWFERQKRIEFSLLFSRDIKDKFKLKTFLTKIISLLPLFVWFFVKLLSCFEYVALKNDSEFYFVI